MSAALVRHAAMLTGRERLVYAALSAATRENLVARARQVRARLLWGPERLHAWRVERARETLLHAAAHVPLYRERFAARGFRAADFRAFEELQRLPVLTRADLRERGPALLDETADPATMVRTSTGGTTGTPVSVYHDRANAVERMLLTHRMYAMAGRRLGTPTLLIAGSPIDAEAWATRREQLKNRLFRITVRSSFDLTPGAIGWLLDQLADRRFPWVIAYASVFDLLAAAASDLRLPPGLRIIPCAELVTQAQRERWRDVLGAESFEIYGSRELNSIAGELPDHAGMMVNGDLYHVEITDPAGKPLPYGEPGLITVTTLRERSMPLIRYQLGDMGVMRPPTGEAPFPRLQITHGRVVDVICCPDGKLLPGEFFPHLMKEVAREVERYQVVQTDVDRLELRVVPHASFSDATREYLIRQTQLRVGPEMRVSLSLVDGIVTSASGKYRPTLNLVPPEERRPRAER